MKVTLKEEPIVAKQRYPFLGISLETKAIVLFTKPNCGVCIDSGERAGLIYVTGQYASNWKMDHFEPYNGSVTLEND